MQFGEEECATLNNWLQEQVVSEEEYSRILATSNELRSAAAASNATDGADHGVRIRAVLPLMVANHLNLISPTGSKAVGCLGFQTSESVRKAVVHHDIVRLMDRVRAGMLVTV